MKKGTILGRSVVVLGILTLTFSAQAAIAGPASSMTSSPIAGPATVADNNPGDVLYAANWSTGLNGWVGGPSWKPLRGMLVNDGTQQYNNLILSPYNTGEIADYAVEARIRVIRTAPGYTSGIFGLAARGSAAGGGYSGVIRVGDAASITETYGTRLVEGQHYVPDSGWHTYRLEVDGNTATFLVDGGRIATVMDNNYLTGGNSGLVAYSYQIEVESYRVLRL